MAENIFKKKLLTRRAGNPLRNTKYTENLGRHLLRGTHHEKSRYPEIPESWQQIWFRPRTGGCRRLPFLLAFISLLDLEHSALQPSIKPREVSQQTRPKAISIAIIDNEILTYFIKNTKQIVLDPM